MVDKQNKTKRKSGIVDQHTDDAGARYAKLEARLEIVLARLEEMTQEVLAIKQQQEDLLNIVKTTLKKK
jgi:hypothetical protein